MAEQGSGSRPSEPVRLVDPATGRPILMAPQRRHRPIHTAPDARERPCPFCPGNEAQTPPEIQAVRTGPGKADGPGWSVRVFPNKYPAAEVHEVIAEGAEHLEQPAELGADLWRVVLGVWQQRIAALESRPDVRCAFLFKNVGGPAGASIAHNHSQILGLTELPPRLELELEQARLLGCPCCATLRTAAAEGRVVAAGSHHVVLCPDPPKLPHETWLLPIRCDDDFLATDLDSLAQALQSLFVSVQRGLGSPPCNLWLHRVQGRAFHWHFEMQPRTGHLAGLELGADVYINSVPAAEAASRLRRALPP